jgi:hypothetical protein
MESVVAQAPTWRGMRLAIGLLMWSLRTWMLSAIAPVSRSRLSTLSPDHTVP